VVVHVDGRPMVLEAISPVSLTPLAQWADRAADGRIAIKRLRDADSALTPEARQRMIALGRSWLGRPYDSRFGWSDDQLYCSELVHKLFVEAGVELGTPHPLRDFDLSDPEVAAAARARFGGALPLDELVVAPVDLYDDPDLVEVCVGPVDVCAR
ncbi:MAG: YiiX/YebB-like N1pC/P60 family cysteine hydrolase, partial [Myxococcota bacterium]